MLRRDLFKITALAATIMALPRIVTAGEATKTIRFIPAADLTLLDNMFSTVSTTAIYADLIHDTLYGRDAKQQVQLQMLEKQDTSDDGKRWTLTLREGMTFHDGEPVRAADAVASLKRWWQTSNAYAQMLRAHTEDLSASGDRDIVFTLKEPFPMLPQALAVASAVVLPERLANTPISEAITESVGCGPYRFVRDRWISGARAEFVRFENYVPRKEGVSSGTAGPKKPLVERVQWQIVPDAATASAALQAGEVDYLERVSSDFVALLKNDPSIQLLKQELPSFLIMRFNQLQPPFNNPGIRRAVLKAVDQREFMLAVQGEENKEYYDDRVGVFSPVSPMANDAGMAFMDEKRDLKKLAQEIRDAGYKGERVVLLDAADYGNAHAAALVAADLLQKLGMNVDIQTMDWGSVGQRRVSQAPVDAGGWSVYFTQILGLPNFDPASHLALRATGTKAWFGWPDSPRLEELRLKWFAAATVEEQQAISREIQEQAWQDVPYVPLGALYNVGAYRKGWTGLSAQTALFYNVDRG